MTPAPLFGPYGSGALAYVDHLADHGANACWFHGFDLRAFETCEQHGIAACVEFPTFRADFARHPELVPVGVDGRPIRCGKLVQGVCLSRAEFLDGIETKLIDGLRECRPTGIWLDYLTGAGWVRGPGARPAGELLLRGLRGGVLRATDVDAQEPTEILNRHAAAWHRHKCERIAGFGARYAAVIRQWLPDCIIGAYMCPWRPDEFGGALTNIFAQDYALLAPHVDVFTPLVYAQKSGRPPEWARAFLEASPEFVPRGSRVQLILDVLDFPDSMAAAADSAVQGWGVQVFGGADVFADARLAGQFAANAEKILSALTR